MNALITFDQVSSLASAVAKSGYYPGIDTPDRAMVLMQIAQAEGCHPIQAMARYNIIKGKPCKQAWAMLADFTASGGKVEWHKHDAACCDATFSHSSGGTIRVTWDLDKARVAGLGGGDNWRKYPENMLHARCVSNGVRFCYPAAANGLYTPEEVQDFDAPFAKLQEPSKQKVEVVSREKAPAAAVQKWDASQALPDAILRALPGSQPLRGKTVADLESVEDVEMLLEQGKAAYTQWRDMPGVSTKALELLREVVAVAQLEYDTRTGLVPPGDE